MICPICRSEHRAGYVTCSDCHVSLVEVLDEPNVPQAAEPEVELSLGERLNNLSVVRQILLVYLVLTATLTGIGAYSLVRLFIAIGDDPFLAGALLGPVSAGTLLPFLAAYGILARRRWARVLTFVYLVSATLRGFLGVVVMPLFFEETMKWLGAGAFHFALSVHSLLGSVVAAWLLWQEDRWSQNEGLDQEESLQRSGEAL